MVEHQRSNGAVLLIGPRAAARIFLGGRRGRILGLGLFLGRGLLQLLSCRRVDLGISSGDWLERPEPVELAERLDAVTCGAHERCES